MDRTQLGCGLVYSHAILQARHSTEKSTTLICSASGRHRQDRPKLRRSARTRTLFNVELKIRRHHADDRKCLTIESYWGSDDIRTTEATLPQSITEHCDWGLICFIVVGEKRATEECLDTEDIEKLRRCKLD